MAKKNRDPQPAAATAKPASRWADYFWANLIFFAFLFILAGIVRGSCESGADDPNVRQAVNAVLSDTFQFLLVLMGGGFLLVTVFDAAYEHFSAQEPQGADNDGGGRA
ncbi:MAG TPA: hypothetical protein VK842_01840 [bacterium]|jgi:hypothetical protein|nr:hypothetical protein [bacterium]